MVARPNALTARFGAVVALDEVSVDVARGEVLALLGDNGAGNLPDDAKVREAVDEVGTAIGICPGHSEGDLQ